MRPKIYITQPVAPSAVERLRAIGDVEMNPDTLHKVTKDELLARVPELDILFCLRTTGSTKTSSRRESGSS